MQFSLRQFSSALACVGMPIEEEKNSGWLLSMCGCLLLLISSKQHDTTAIWEHEHMLWKARRDDICAHNERKQLHQKGAGPLITLIALAKH